MHTHETEPEPVEPRVFVEKTREELTQILKQHGPIWGPKLKNFIELQEGAAFRSGFYFGTILAAITVLILFFVARV